MDHYYVLYNPLSGNGRGEADVHKLDLVFAGKTLTYQDIRNITSMPEHVANIPDDAGIVVAGGDGTLNRFVNSLEGHVPEREILYFATGTGNDFLNDIGVKIGSAPIRVNEYISDLPVVHVNGMDRFFFNGIGYGIDGYACEIGDKIRATSDKPVNYTMIALKGLLYDYHRTHATIHIDGEEHSYEKVWLAPTMNGRYIGGGMMIAPQQDRLNSDGSVSLMVMRCKSKLKTLLIFPSIFKGKHIKHTKVVDIFHGHDIHVSFDRPTALQIDGETVLAVTEYSVTAPRLSQRKQPQPTEAEITV